MTDLIHDTVRDFYAHAALNVLIDDRCCGECCCDTGEFGSGLHSALERDALPSAAVLASTNSRPFVAPEQAKAHSLRACFYQGASCQGVPSFAFLLSHR